MSCDIATESCCCRRKRSKFAASVTPGSESRPEINPLCPTSDSFVQIWPTSDQLRSNPPRDCCGPSQCWPGSNVFALTFEIVCGFLVLNLGCLNRVWSDWVQHMSEFYTFHRCWLDFDQSLAGLDQFCASWAEFRPISVDQSWAVAAELGLRVGRAIEAKLGLVRPKLVRLLQQLARVSQIRAIAPDIWTACFPTSAKLGPIGPSSAGFRRTLARTRPHVRDFGRAWPKFGWDAMKIRPWGSTRALDSMEHLSYMLLGNAAGKGGG